MTFAKRAETNSLMCNNDGSIFSKTLLTLFIITALISGALYVFAADVDVDGFDDTTPTENLPKDCDDTSATVRPLKNQSETLVGYNIKVCPYRYYNTTLIVNSSSNNSVIIDCSGTDGAFANFSLTGGNASLRNLILINNTVGGVTIANCSAKGYFQHTADGIEASRMELNNTQATESIALNITNSSNVNVNTFQVLEFVFGGVVIGGHGGGNGTAANISISISLENISANISGGAAPRLDMIRIYTGTNINISNSNFTLRGNAGNVSASQRLAINSSPNNVIIYNNRLNINGVEGVVRMNGSNHYIVNNSFGNGTTGLWLISSNNNTITTNNFTISGMSAEISNLTNGALFIQTGVNNTINKNVFGNNSHWCVHISGGSRNSITNNAIDNCTGDVLINQSNNNNLVNNNVTNAENWLLLVNYSDNISLRGNRWINSTAVGLEFINGSNASLLGEHVYNVSMKGIIFNRSANVRIENVSVETFNNSAADYAFDFSNNMTMTDFNSTFAGSNGLHIDHSTTVNISSFYILNATDNGILITNSSGILSDYDNIQVVNNITGLTVVGINVTTNSSHINISTLRIMITNWTTARYKSATTWGIWVNGSSNISFHNVSVFNATANNVVYGNSTLAQSTLGFCTLQNAGLLNLVASMNSRINTFNCTPITNVNMSNVTLQVFTNTGSSVIFTTPVNITGGTVESYVNLTTPDLIYVNQTMLGGGNAVAANVVMQGFNYAADGVLVDYEDDGSFHGCGTNCTITASGARLAFNVSHFSSYQASRKVTTGSVSGGGGTGGSRGGGYKTVVPTATGVTVQLTNYDMARIQYGTGAYQFTLKRAGRDEVDMRIAQQDYKLAVSKAVSIDLDKDGKTDVTVSLISVTHNLATFVVKLSAPAPAKAPAPIPVATTVPSEPSALSAPLPEAGKAVEEDALATGAEEAGIAAEAPVAAAKKKLGATTVLGIIVAVIVILLVVMHFRKKKEAF